MKSTLRAAVTSPTYSASIDDSVIISCLEEYQAIRPPTAKHTNCYGPASSFTDQRCVLPDRPGPVAVR